MNIILRSDAKKNGQKFFFEGKTCKHGHLSKRLVSDGKCHSCRLRDWEKVRRRKGKFPAVVDHAKRAAEEAGENTYQGKPCVHGHSGHRWTHNGLCFDCSKVASAKHAKHTGYAAIRAWAKLNTDKISVAKKKYRSTEKGKVSSRKDAMLRRARKIDASSVAFTASELAQKMSMYGNRCAYCYGEFHHVDHVIPLSKGGLHILSNLRPACRACNCSKWNKSLNNWLSMKNAGGYEARRQK